MSTTHSKPILCLDFDGVIHRYSKGWQGGLIYDPPTDGFFDWLVEAQDKFDVCIYSSRSSTPQGINAMRAWLYYHAAAWEIGNSHITHTAMYQILSGVSFASEKPAAYLTIDDRALTFTGKWSDFHPEELIAFKPWNMKDT